MELPEDAMKEGFESLSKVQRSFQKASVLYTLRNDQSKADIENTANVKNALQLLAKAYDEVSAIWENDINV